MSKNRGKEIKTSMMRYGVPDDKAGQAGSTGVQLMFRAGGCSWVRYRGVKYRGEREDRQRTCGSNLILAYVSQWPSVRHMGEVKFYIWNSQDMNSILCFI